jgi:hypothetical protein
MTIALIFLFFTCWCLKDLIQLLPYGPRFTPPVGMAIAFVIFLLLYFFGPQFSR